MFLFDYLHTDLLVLILFTILSFIVLRLGRRLNERDALVSNLQKEVEALLLCERGIADRIKQQQSQMRGISSRQDKLEINESSQVNYRQAMALLNKGISTDELVEACDISRGEVDLISHMQKLKRTAPPARRAA